MKDGFETFDHTADIGLRVRAGTLAELYANAARGLLSLLSDPARVRRLEETRLTVEGRDRADLLVAWLHEILYRFDAEGRVFGAADVTDATETRLTAVLRGEPMDRTRHELRLEIKAVTYHRARVERTADGWEAEVVFDV